MLCLTRLLLGFLFSPDTTKKAGALLLTLLWGHRSLYAKFFLLLSLLLPPSYLLLSSLILYTAARGEVNGFFEGRSGIVRVMTAVAFTYFFATLFSSPELALILSIRADFVSLLLLEPSPFISSRPRLRFSFAHAAATDQHDFFYPHHQEKSTRL